MFWNGIVDAAATATRTRHCPDCLVAWETDTDPSCCWACNRAGTRGPLPRVCYAPGTYSAPFADAAVTGILGDI